MSFLAGGSGTRQQAVVPDTALRIQTSLNGQVIPFGYGRNRIAGNLVWYGGFTATGVSQGGGGGKGGGGQSGSPSSYNYSASLAIGLCEGPINEVLSLWNGDTPDSLSDLNFTSFDGYEAQAAWGYLTTNFPSQALTYSNLAYVGADPYQLGSSPDLPNLNFDVSFAIGNAVLEDYTIGSPYTFTPSYFTLDSAVTEITQIPASGPYTYQAQNPFAMTSIPVIVGQINGASLPGSASNGVIFTDTGSPLTKVTMSPSTGEYTVTAAGLYGFAAADAGANITIIDFAQSPGVNYIVQPTGTLTQGSTSITSVSSLTGVSDGDLIAGVGIPAGTVVNSASGSTIVMSAAATTGGTSVTLTVWGAPLVQVLGTPATGQFSVSVTAAAYGKYTFASADNGKLVQVIDVPDADPAAVTIDALSNPRYGCGIPASFLSSFSTMQDYAFALGLFVSPVMTSATVANSFFADLATGLNGEFVWSGSLLTFVPYGDQDATGFGKTYTAPSAAIYSLDDDDFLPNEGASDIGNSAFSSEDPVSGVRTPQKSALNDIKVEYLDRGNSYNPAVAEAQDDAAINDYGLRPADTKSLHFFCSESAAIQSAQLQLGRQAVRNQYAFTVPWYYILLDPMDIIEITDEAIGLDNQWVRILEITENQEDWTLSITCEEVLDGTGSTPVYGQQAKAGFTPNNQVAPGNANDPAIFDVPVQLVQYLGMETWLATDGGANWGGCEVWISSATASGADSGVYQYGATINGGSIMGTLTSGFAGVQPTGNVTSGSASIVGVSSLSGVATDDLIAGTGIPPGTTIVSATGTTIVISELATASNTGVTLTIAGDPDTTDTLAVELTGTATTLTAGTTVDADNGNTICYVDGEYVTYSAVTMTSAQHYSMGTYLRRAFAGSPFGAHAIGSLFVRLMANTYAALPYTQGQIGQTIYIKLLSFNLWGNAKQTLADVSAYTHIIGGPGNTGALAPIAQVTNSSVASDYPDLVMGAATNGASAFTAASQLVGSSNTLIQSVSITTVGGTVFLQFTLAFSHGIGTGDSVIITLENSSTAIFTSPNFTLSANSTINLSFSYTDSPSAGTQTYNLYASCTSGNDHAADVSLSAIEFRR